MKIAVLDNDQTHVDFICRTLGDAGHVCCAFSEGRNLMWNLNRQTFDLLVLESHLLDMAASQLLYWIRHSLSAYLPVLFVSARKHEIDIAAMLNSGADDYIVKPVSEAMLLARVGSLLRRAYYWQQPTPKMAFGPYEFDPKSHQASFGGRLVPLTQKEFALALLLFQHVSQPLSREYILDAIWRQHAQTPSRTMDTHMSMLRSKLDLRSENGYQLIPIYNFGYRLDRVHGEDGDGQDA